MKIAVEFPSIAFREGPAKIAEMARAIEEIGYDELAVFDHVVMGYPTDTRAAPMYPPKMPILEALMMLALMATVLALGVTGWMQTTDTFFGEEWLMELHEVLAHGLLIAAGLHAAAAIVMGRVERVRLVRAMVTGTKQHF